MTEQKPDVSFSGSPNTMIAFALVASALALAIGVFNLGRIRDVEAYLRIQAVRAAKLAAEAGDGAKVAVPSGGAADEAAAP